MKRLAIFYLGRFAHSGLWQKAASVDWKDNIRNLRSRDPCEKVGVRKRARYTAGFPFKTLPNYELVHGEAKRLNRKSLKSIAEIWQIHNAEETITVQNLPEEIAGENTQSHTQAREN